MTEKTEASELVPPVADELAAMIEDAMTDEADELDAIDAAMATAEEKRQAAKAEWVRQGQIIVRLGKRKGQLLVARRSQQAVRDRIARIQDDPLAVPHGAVAS